MTNIKTLGVHTVFIGVFVMIDDVIDYNLNSEKIVVEVRQLIKNVESVENEVNVYCELMKQMFLSMSNKN